MGRTQTTEIIKRVMRSISSGPKSITEVAKDCELGWESVKNYLEALKDSGIAVEVETKGNERRFTRPTPISDKREGNYFGLPLDEETKKIIDSIYHKLDHFWRKHNKDRIPRKTHVQKMIKEVNDEFELGLPIGWYQFGSLCVRVYSPDKEYSYSSLDSNILSRLEGLVEQYSRLSAYEVMRNQYADEGNVLYMTKEDLNRLFTRADAGPTEIKSKLYTFIRSIPPYITDSTTLGLVDDFSALVISAYNSIEPRGDLQTIAPHILCTFREIWKLLALYNYKETLKDFYDEYGEEVLDFHFRHDIVFQQFEAKDHLGQLHDFVPDEREPEDGKYLGFKSSIQGG